MPIEWRSQMSIGNKSVDKDHKYLIQLINDFEQSVETLSNITNLVIALKKMKEYTAMHFSKEEKLQRSVGFPRHEDHKKQHRHLEKKLDQMLFSLENQKLSSERPEDDLIKFIEFIRGWFINHVIKEDLLLKPYLDSC